MPFTMKIQPIDFNTTPEEEARYEPIKPVAKSRLKRLFERQFSSVLRISNEKAGVVEDLHCNKDVSSEFEPSSVCLAKMVQNFMEETNEKQWATVKCGRQRCNCFNRNSSDSSEDESDNCFNPCEVLKSLVVCASVSERNLLVDTAKIVEKNKISKRKDDYCRNIVTDGLLALGYDASICKSQWEKSPSYPAGGYEYVDVIVESERLIIDIDFRSEFKIARSTKTYKLILKTLPHIFVGKHDRLQRIISIVSESAKQSLKKKDMHLPPWRKAEYVKAKWFSHYTRSTEDSSTLKQKSLCNSPEEKDSLIASNSSSGETFGEKETSDVFSLSNSSGEEEEKTAVVKLLEPPEIRPKSLLIGRVKVVTGLSSVFEEDEP